MRKYISALFVMLAFLCTMALAQSGYKVSGTIEIGGDPRWDYLAVEEGMNRLYVSQGSRVVVVDLAKNNIIGEISGLQGVHGIAFSPETGKGYISCGKDNSVTVFDLKSLKSLKHFEVTGKRPDAIMYDPFTKHIFTMNAGSANATAINPENDSLLGTVDLAKGPEAAVSDGNGKIYVNSEDENLIVAFDAVTLKQIAKWSIAPVEGPTGLAMDITNKRLFSTGKQKMAVVDAESGKVLALVPTGKGTDGAAFDPATGYAFSSNGEGTVTVVKETKPGEFSVVENVPTVAKARTIALDNKTHKIYLSTVIDGKDGKKVFGVVVLSKD